MRGLFRLGLASTLLVGATSVKAAPATNLVISYCGPQVVQNCLPSIHYFDTPISFRGSFRYFRGTDYVG